MGVDQLAGQADDAEMHLRGAGADQQQVACLRQAVHFCEASNERAIELGGEVALTHGVRRNRGNLPPDALQRRGDESDAIDACCWIAAAEAERDADEALRRLGEGPPQTHDEPG